MGAVGIIVFFVLVLAGVGLLIAADWRKGNRDPLGVGVISLMCVMATAVMVWAYVASH